ncbi:hypothetical protein [Flavobacterium sp. 7A]|uniref:hypothetical protein n=1 Tax=Flavobacterium sp. 7A TaxID=2940571 RepID=UPI002225F3D6|nr:hypothetical protein [Flavobacterium sp. 7A]MCW2119608.1 hypothetical protein [Flavobacterium sp. 7A]
MKQFLLISILTVSAFATASNFAAHSTIVQKSISIPNYITSNVSKESSTNIISISNEGPGDDCITIYPPK